MSIRTFCITASLAIMAACSTPVEYEDAWLDSPLVSDPALTDPSVRVSTRPGMTEADRATPVVIAVHGFTATTYEWEEFNEYAEQDGGLFVSRVLLGGHGRSIAEFEESTWQDWGRPILDEYNALVDQGYENVNLAAASTGGALILEQISAGRFDRHAPRHFFFIDPIVVPGDKNLTMVNVFGPLLDNIPQSDNTEDESRHWYTNRPTETMEELYAICKRVRRELADGFRLPEGARAKVYKTSRDETADPVSGLLIYKGLRTSDGSKMDVEMFDSDLHVFTRLRGRDPAEVDDEDRRRQQRVFAEMASMVKNSTVPPPSPSARPVAYTDAALAEIRP